MTRAIGYVRVSTAEQAKDGYGMSAQRETIMAECERREWELIDIVGEDGGASAKSLDRAGLQSVTTRLDRHEADLLVVSKMDRLSRSLAQGASVIERATAQGWGIVALDMGIDMSTPSGELLANMLLSAARFERRMIGQRTKEGLAVARSEGKVFGRPPRIPVEVVERIRNERNQGRSFQKIADGLNADAVPTSQCWRKVGPKADEIELITGRIWYASSVRVVCNRSA